MRLRFFYVSFLVFLSLQAGEPNSKEILLGQSAAFTGPSAGLGTELWRGAQAYFDQVNAAGGVHGKKIRVISLDDQYNGDKTLPNTIDLITKHKIFALFGYVGTPTLVKALPAIQRYFPTGGPFLFSDFTGAQPQREMPHAQYVYNIRASYREETAALVDYLVRKGVTQIGLFIQDDAYGRSGADGVQRALASHGLAPAMETSYRRGQVFSDSMLEQAKLLQNTQAIVSIGSYAPCAAFIRDVRKLGYKGMIANVSFVGPDALLDLLSAAEKKEKIGLTHHLINSQVVPPWSDTTYPLVREYRKAMEQYHPELSGLLKDPVYVPKKYSFGGLEGFLNAKAFVEILKRDKGVNTRNSFMKTAESIPNLDLGIKAPFKFTSKRHQALDSVYLTTIQNGQYVQL